MPKTFLTADLHLGEPAERLKILGRPFKDQKHHIEELIRLHNSIVAPEDIVYVAGDVCYQKAPEFLPEVARFNGKKILIRGNHDRPICDADFHQYFDRIVEDGGGIPFNVEGIQCWVTHYPTQGQTDSFNLVGHIHAAWKYQLNMFNIGIDANHFLPVDLATVPFHFKAICEFYDADVWVGYNPLNEAYKGKRGKATRYFNPKLVFPPEPDFDEVVERYKKKEIIIPNFCIYQEGKYWWAYLMGEGAEQLIAKKRFDTKQEIIELYGSLGITRVGIAG